MPAHIEIDRSRAPMFLFRFIGDYDDAQFEAYLGQMDQIIGLPRPRALIYDATHSGSVSARQRKLQAEWMSRNEANTREFTVGVAFVIPGALLRGVLTAIMWITPMACPYEICADPDDAIDWCKKQLAERQLRDESGPAAPV